ncbi:MAG: NfeD family protein [Beijerinckiaceae bacterium]|nr:NfeD family protein [Beijerinckiaceae bacterium]
MAPGMFLLWLGVAALATGLLLIAFDLSFAWQLLSFGALAVAAVLIGRRFYGSSERESDQPFLNRRADALVGRTFVLAQPVKAGEGRLTVNDTQWRLRGPDMPAGSKVRVVRVEESTFLVVEQA